MELSQVKGYGRKPISDEFPVGDAETLSVTWDKAAFTGRFFAWLDDELKAAALPLEKEGKRLQKLAEELDSEGQGELSDADRVKRQEKQIEFNSRIVRISAGVEDAKVSVYAKALSERVLLGWGMTNGGEPVEATFDVLKVQHLQFLIDLYQWCRAESLPKLPVGGQTTTTTGANPTTSEISSSSTPEKRATRQRKGPRSLSIPTNSESPECAASV